MTLTTAVRTQDHCGCKISKEHDWQTRLPIVVDIMREMSTHTDPQAMVRQYGKRVRELWPADRMVALSRRGLEAPYYRITRNSLWKEEVNPWKQKDRLPLLRGGLLGELLYSEQPRIIDEIEVDPGDPAREVFDGMRSLIAVPQFDQGKALNMVIIMRQRPASFEREDFPEFVWITNLFGRATHNLVLSDELREAYVALDHELRTVGEIQRSLLPEKLPQISTMGLAAYYQTSQRAGGDYYDFFPLHGGRWGILIADVSGHGTPAAVIMAVLHCIAHTYPGESVSPAALMNYVNDHLTRLYTRDSATFVTAFYGVYDPKSRELTYTSAGHPPPRLKRCQDGTMASLHGAQGLPLGIMDQERYTETTQALQIGDQIIFFTDGISEAAGPTGELFGVERVDASLETCSLDADGLIRTLLESVNAFTHGAPPADDQTVLVAKIR